MPKKSSPSARALLARASIAGTPGNIRALYTQIARGDSRSGNPALLFADLMYDVFPMDTIRAVLTEEEIRKLRSCILTSFLLDLRGNVITGELPIPALRHTAEEYYHAIQLLGPPTDKDPLMDQVYYASLCARLDRHREARDVSRKLLARQPRGGFAKVLQTYAADHMSFPRFRFSFVSRCSYTWKASAVTLQDYSRGYVDGDLVSGDIQRNFALWTGLTVNPDCISPEKGGTLDFSIKDWQLSLFPSQAAIAIGLAELPEKLSEAWPADFSASNRRITIVSEDGSRLSLGDALTAVKDTPQHDGVHLQVYHPLFVYGETSSDIMGAMETEVASVLGTPDYCVLIRSIQILKRRTGSFTGTIDTLQEQLKGLGYTLGHDISEVESRRMFRKYTRKPADGPATRLRDDIRRGDTILWCLQQDYDRNETTSADYFMDRGIAPVFLAWPKSILGSDEEAFLSQLLHVLTDTSVGLSLKPLGTAYGTQYNYLDLLVFDVPAVVEAFEKFLAQIPGGDTVRIQSFYYDAAPCPVSKARMEEHSVLPDPDKYYSILPAAQRSRGKKKNSAKSKRKHR